MIPRHAICRVPYSDSLEHCGRLPRWAVLVHSVVGMDIMSPLVGLGDAWCGKRKIRKLRCTHDFDESSFLMSHIEV